MTSRPVDNSAVRPSFSKRTTIWTPAYWILVPLLMDMLLLGVCGRLGIQSWFDASRTGHALTVGGVAAIAIAVVTAVLPFVVVRLRRPGMTPRTGRTEADVLGLTFDGKRVVRRGQVSFTHVMHAEYGLVLRFLGWFGILDVSVETEDEASALLRAMRLDRAQCVSSFALGTWSARRTAAYLGAVLAVNFGWLFGGAGFLRTHAPDVFRWHFGITLVVMLTTLLIVLREGMTLVEVGADGMFVKHPLGRGEFTPFSAVTMATCSGRTITITLRGGRSLSLSAEDEALAVLLVERIQAAIADARDGATGNAALLTRSDQSTAAWLRSALAASDEAASFRQPAVPPDVLWRIVEDPSAVPTARVGAAVALRHRLDDDGRSRLRIAADACAERPLRGALEAVATGCSEDELLEQFEQLEPVVDPEASPRARRVGV